MDIATWRRRRALSLRREVIVVMAAAGAAAAAVVVWSVMGSQGAWWVVGAIALAALQVIAAINVTLAQRP